MKTFPKSGGRLTALSALALAFGLASGTLAAKDVYKSFLDPAVPNHRAILDTLDKLKDAPDDSGLHNDLACLVARDGFWRDALRELDEAARLDPKDSRPLHNAGLVNAWRGDWASAESSFRKATKRDPGNWPAWWMLGFALEMQGKEPAAVEAYKVSLRLDTSLFDPFKNPFAAASRLKGIVLLETYQKRVVKASLAASQQLTDPDRLGILLQPSRPLATTVAAPTASVASPAASDEAASRSGPVVVMSQSGGSPGGATNSQPQQQSPPPTSFRPAPTRIERPMSPADGNAPRRYPPDGRGAEQPKGNDPGIKPTPPPMGPGGVE